MTYSSVIAILCILPSGELTTHNVSNRSNAHDRFTTKWSVSIIKPHHEKSLLACNRSVTTYRQPLNKSTCCRACWGAQRAIPGYYLISVSYTHLRAHETGRNLVCRLLLEKKIIRKHGNMSLVKWVGYPKSFNSCVEYKDLIKL